MQKLANFRIETDSVVWLQFVDGVERRLPRRTLAKHLGPEDVAKVRAAYALRRDFLRRHMPRAGVLLVLVTTAAFVIGAASPTVRQHAASLLRHQSTRAVSPDGVTRHASVAPTATPTASPLPPTPAVTTPPAQPASLTPTGSRPSAATTGSQGPVGQALSPVIQPATGLVDGLLAPVITSPPVGGLGNLLGL